MQKYHFLIELWNRCSEFRSIEADTYDEALRKLYNDEHVIGATLKALTLWGGRCVISQQELYTPGVFDVPSLALS
jgi:hypothetical protein